MGRVCPSLTLFIPTNLLTLTQIPVPLGLSTRPGPTDSWLRTHRGIRALGGLWCKESNVPEAPAAGSSHPRPHLGHYIHLRSQLLFHSHVLANASLRKFHEVKTIENVLADQFRPERIWPRPDRCGRQRYSSWILHPGRRLHCAVATVCI